MHVNNWHILILIITIRTTWTLKIAPNLSHLKQFTLTIGNLDSVGLLEIVYHIWYSRTIIMFILWNWNWIIFVWGFKKVAFSTFWGCTGSNKSSLVFNLILFSASFIVFLFSHHGLCYHGNIISSQEGADRTILVSKLWPQVNQFSSKLIIQQSCVFEQNKPGWFSFRNHTIIRV